MRAWLVHFFVKSSNERMISSATLGLAQTLGCCRVGVANPFIFLLEELILLVICFSTYAPHLFFNTKAYMILVTIKKNNTDRSDTNIENTRVLLDLYARNPSAFLFSRIL
jgi:hypothetical protein